MIINKEGKLFGKISIVDIAVVLIAVVLFVGIYFRFFGESRVVMSAGKNIECTFLVKNVRDYTVNALEKSENVYDPTTKEFIGRITDVKKDDGLYVVSMSDGTFEEAVPEDRYNVYVTVEFTGKAGETGYYTAANRLLGVGSSLNISTKYSMCGATVYSINEK